MPDRHPTLLQITAVCAVFFALGFVGMVQCSRIVGDEMARYERSLQ